MVLCIYSIIVCSVDQCFGACVTCHPGGNWNLRWHWVVLPLQINCTGRKSPSSVQQNIAVIRCLSLTPTISIWLNPSLSIVQVEDGTIWIPVWSQFTISSSHTSSISTVSTIASKNCHFSSAKLVTSYLLWDKVTFLWTNFISWNNKYAQCRVLLMCPPYYTQPMHPGLGIAVSLCCCHSYSYRNNTSIHYFLVWLDTAAIFHQVAHQVKPFSLLFLRHSFHVLVHA